jgi:hypothetical protein
VAVSSVPLVSSVATDSVVPAPPSPVVPPSAEVVVLLLAVASPPVPSVVELAPNVTFTTSAVTATVEASPPTLLALSSPVVEVSRSTDPSP